MLYARCIICRRKLKSKISKLIGMGRKCAKRAKGREQISMYEEEKIKFIRSKGWRTWYHPDYWVHEKTIVDPKRQDCTNYGMSLEDAYNFEVNNEKPFDGAYGFARFRGEQVFIAPNLA